MDRKTYIRVTSLIFLAIALVHGLRVLYGWEGVIGDWEVPIGLSYFVVVIAVALAWVGYTMRK